MSDSKANQWSIPALVVALLALFGVAYAPGGGRGNSSGVPLPAPSASAPDPEGGTGIAPPILDSVTDEDREALAILEPLARFYAPRIARLKASGDKIDKPVDRLLQGMPSSDSSHDGDRLDLMIAVVPHPELSGSAYRYDNAIAAIQLAMRAAGYLLDDYRIPWQGTASAPAGSSSTATASLGVEVEWNSSGPPSPSKPAHQPGMILFRKYPASDDTSGAYKDDDTSHALYAVLLVTDTPIRGIDPAMMTRALDLSLRHWKSRPPAEQNAKSPVRIMGPNFSGSPSSIARTLDAWVSQHESDLKPSPNSDVRQRRPIEWIAGVALAVNDKPLLGGDTLATGAGAPKRFYRYRMVTHNNKDFNDFLIDFIDRQSSNPVRVAILSEETTGWGYAFGKAANSEAISQVREADNQAPVPRDRIIYRYTFPLHVAEVRRRYQQAAEASRGGGPLQTAERLDFMLGEGRDTPERIAPASPSTTAANDEMRLLRVARDIERHGIGHVILHATDMRDTIFVAEYLRTHCPDTRLYGIVGEQAFTQQHRIAALRGMVFASTYPLDDHWTRPPSRKTLDGGDPLFLPGHASYGVYNATLAHIIEAADPGPGRTDPRPDLFRAMYNYGRPDDRSACTPPLWLLIASQRGYYPLTVGTPPAGPPEYLWTPPDGTFKPRSWEVGADAFAFDEAAGWCGVFLAASVALLAVSVLYLRHYVSLFVFGSPIRQRGSSSASTSQQPSTLLDHFGYSCLRRDADPGDFVVRRRRSTHLIFKVSTWLGYTILAAPVWRLDLPSQLARWGSVLGSLVHLERPEGPLSGAWLALVFLPTWVASLASLIASVDVFSRRRLSRWSPRRFGPGADLPPWRPRLHLALVSAATLVLAFGLLSMVLIPETLTLSIPGDEQQSDFLAALFCERATALASGISPMLPLVLLVSACSYSAYHRLRAIWAVRTFGGRSGIGPVPGTGREDPAIRAFLLARGRLKQVAQSGLFELGRRHLASVVLAGAALVLVALTILGASHRASVVGLEPRWIGSLLVVGLILFFALLIPKIAHMLLLWAQIEKTSSATLTLPMAGAFDRLPAPLIENFGSYFEAIQGEEAGSLVLPTASQQAAVALRDALDEAAPALDPSGVLRLRAHLDRPPGRRDGSMIARACIGLLLPFWESRPVEQAYPDPASPSPSPPVDGPPALSRFVDRAEAFVALELLRDLNRPMTVLWLRLTSVTVLSLILLMVVNSYPFRISGQLFGLAALTVAFAGVSIVRVLWGIQRNGLIRRSTGSFNRSAFNADFLGKLITYVAPLVLGLIAALSFAASDILRVMLGRLLG